MKKPQTTKKQAKSPVKGGLKSVARPRRAMPAKQSAAIERKVEPGDEMDEKEHSTQRPDEMDGDLLEFVKAIDHYKREHRRQFPSWGEVLHVLKSLGFKRSA